MKTGYIVEKFTDLDSSEVVGFVETEETAKKFVDILQDEDPDCEVRYSKMELGIPSKYTGVKSWIVEISEDMSCESVSVHLREPKQDGLFPKVTEDWFSYRGASRNGTYCCMILTMNRKEAKNIARERAKRFKDCWPSKEDFQGQGHLLVSDYLKQLQDKEHGKSSDKE